MNVYSTVIQISHPPPPPPSGVLINDHHYLIARLDRFNYALSNN